MTPIDEALRIVRGAIKDDSCSCWNPTRHVEGNEKCAAMKPLLAVDVIERAIDEAGASALESEASALESGEREADITDCDSLIDWLRQRAREIRGK